MLEGHQDTAVARSNRRTNKGALLEAAGQFGRLAPGLEGVVARQIPGAEVIGPVFRVGREEERRAAFADEDFGRALADRQAFAREADVERRERRPRSSFVLAAGDGGVVQRGRLGVAAGQHEVDPRAVGHQAQGRVADHSVGRVAFVRDAGAVLLGIDEALGRPLGVSTDAMAAEFRVRCLGRFVHERARDLGLLGDVLFRELREQNLGIGMAIPVVEDVDRAVRCLEAVGVGDRGAVVEQEARAPGLTVILRDESAEAGAAGQLDVDRAVLHE